MSTGSAVAVATCIGLAVLTLYGCNSAGGEIAVVPAAPKAPQAPNVPKAPKGDRPLTPKADPNAPVELSGEVDLREAPYRPAGFDRVDATFTGSIHSPLPGGVFFKRPEFSEADNDGRLYFARYLSRQGKGSFGFIRWRPLGAKTETAQRVVPIVRYSVEDFETDGTVVRVQHYPPWPQKKPILIQEYRWDGDDAGDGRFVLRGTRKGEVASW